jgi:putative phage-type endonuclease
MKILETGIQGSFEWLQARKNTFGASEASAMLGISSYKTRDQLLKEKATGITPDVDASTQARFDRGHEIEATMRPVAEEIIGDELYPVSGALESNELITASFDGLTMLNDVAWECKTLNKKLRESLSLGIIPDEYHPQLEQQLLVSGAEKSLFMAGQSPDDYLYAWYTSNQELRQRIILGWEQFEIDMQNYQHSEAAPVAVAAPIRELPAITYRLNGFALQSNLADYKAAALQLVEDSKKPLETDQDFADREALCKSFKTAEDKLKNIRDMVIGEVADIDRFCKDIEQIGELIRQARLAGEKQITSRKESIKAEIVREAGFALTEFLADLSKSIAPLQLPSITADFAGAIKGKKTVESLKSACNDLLASTKIEANQIHNKISLNQKTLREQASEYPFLFADEQQLVMKENDDLVAVIKNRINDHKEQEQARLDAVREKIRQEEQAKLAHEEEQRLEQAKRDAENAAMIERNKTLAAEQLGSEKAVSQSEPSLSQVAEPSAIANVMAPEAKPVISREAVISLVAKNWEMGAVQAESYLVEYFGKKPATKSKSVKVA